MPRPRKVAQRMMDLFRGNERAHGTHREPVFDPAKNKWGIVTTARTVREPVTLDMWEDHLAGRRPLGVVPIMSDGNVWWGSDDVDDYESDLGALVRATYEHQLPLVPVRSKSGGLHLFVFPSEPTPAAVLREWLRGVAARLGVAGCEVFPKQSSLDPTRSDVGNWMCMPYLGTTYGGKLANQVALGPDGEELSVEEFLDLAEARRATPDDLMRAGDHRPPRGAPFADGPPCLQRMWEAGVDSGGRNNALMQAGKYYKLAHPEDWEARLEEFNQKVCRPPLPAEEVSNTIRSLKKKDYQYLCSADPMQKFCDASTCAERRFGVGDQSGRAVRYPRVLNLVQYLSEPPTWTLEMEDGVLEQVETDDVFRYVQFQKVCAERLGRRYGLLSQKDWDARMSRFSDWEKRPPPDDAAADAAFYEMLRDFLTNSRQGRNREDVWNGKPWVDEEGSGPRGPGYYFRLGDLMRHLSRESSQMRDRRSWVARQIKRLPGHWNGPVRIKDESRERLWYLPLDAVQARQPADAPPVPDVPI